VAKLLVMVVRIAGLAAIVVGALLWSGRPALLGPHIGIGFAVAIVVFIMAVMALMRKAIGVGVAGIVLACLLPVVGFMQLPLTFHGLSLVQVVHVMIGLVAIGLAERLYSGLHS